MKELRSREKVDPKPFYARLRGESDVHVSIWQNLWFNVLWELTSWNLSPGFHKFFHFRCYGTFSWAVFRVLQWRATRRPRIFDSGFKYDGPRLRTKNVRFHNSKWKLVSILLLFIILRLPRALFTYFVFVLQGAVRTAGTWSQEHPLSTRNYWYRRPVISNHRWIPSNIGPTSTALCHVPSVKRKPKWSEGRS